MSMPLTPCLIFRAARNEDDGASRKRLQDTIEYNRKHGGFSFWACKHTPACIATEAQLFDLFTAHPDVAKLIDQIIPDEHGDQTNQKR